MLHVASDNVIKIYPRGLLRAGRSIPPSTKLAVDRWVHAYEAGSERTLCGRKVGALYWEPFKDLDFASVNDAFHCVRCAEVAT